MHNAAFRALGLDAVYVALPCTPAEAGMLVRYLARSGGGGNVTIPHKGVAAEALDRATELVRVTSACNTFWGVEGAIAGDNTDVGGVLAALDALEAVPDAWLVAGTGGSARAVLAAARERGAAVAIRSRDAGRAAALEAWARERGMLVVPPEECTVVVNATPVGLAGEPHAPVPAALVPRARVALDLVYRRGETVWIRQCRERGLRAADGREVLVQQGALAFARWFPGTGAPVEVMRAAVQSALA
jgi:shikimate dehydrogenase